MGVKLGNLDVSFKLGSGDCTVYLGETLIYSGDTPTPPTPTGDYKWLATYTGGTTSSADCDASSAITSGEITFEDLVSVEIGDCVTEIGNYAFYDCTSLSSITIPSGITSIDAYAFMRCSGLVSLTIGSGVTSIVNDAFNYCSGLTSITCLATTPPTLSGKRQFNNTNNCPIYVPSASVSAYQSATYWETYASRIQAIPTPSPQWVTFNSGDDISGLDIYGIKGNALDLSNNGIINLTGGIGANTIEFDFSRNVVNVSISGCYSDSVAPTDNVEYIFSNIGCSDYFTTDAGQTAGTTFQLYIYQ